MVVVWSQWCPAAWPFGWALAGVFARRLQQLGLPLRPLDVAQGIDSRVLAVVDHDGVQLGAAWLRSLRANGQTVYSGWYGTTQLPLARGPSIRVMFPLPNGSLAVFLRPTVEDDGALRLTSRLAAFGDDGAYLIVVRGDGETAWVRASRWPKSSGCTSMTRAHCALTTCSTSGRSPSFGSTTGLNGHPDGLAIRRRHCSPCTHAGAEGVRRPCCGTMGSVARVVDPKPLVPSTPR